MRRAASSPPGPPREVRIIGGLWKRSKLPVADRPGLRPTPDRVRETVFNWLGQTLDGWRCVDAFAGSGALGFEAASRGAAEVVLVERDAALVASLRATQQRLQADPVRVERADALQWLARAAAGSAPAKAAKVTARAVADAIEDTSAEYAAAVTAGEIQPPPSPAVTTRWVPQAVLALVLPFLAVVLFTLV